MATSIPNKVYVTYVNGLPSISVMPDISRDPNAAYLQSQFQEVKSADQLRAAAQAAQGYYWAMVSRYQPTDTYRATIENAARQYGFYGQDLNSMSLEQLLNGLSSAGYAQGVTADAIKTGIAGDSNYTTLTPEEQKLYGFDSPYVSTKSLADAKKYQADIASGALVPIPGQFFANGQQAYAPAGSPAVTNNNPSSDWIAANPGVTQPQPQFLSNQQSPVGAQPLSTSSTPQLPIPPTANLGPGSSGDDVKKLQDFLVGLGLMTQADVNTGYGTYGPKTTAAVTALQQQLGIDNSSGPGYWGPLTMNAVQTGLKQVAQQTTGNTQTQTATGGAPSNQGGDTLTAESFGLTGQNADMFNLLKGYLDKLTANGQSINPNIEITPERVTEFMSHAQSNIDQFIPYASKEIKPYYENQLKIAREGFLRGLGYTQEQLTQNEADLERKFSQTQRRIGETSADQGFAQSGARRFQEQQNIDDTQRALNSARLQTGQNVNNAAATFAQNYGTENLPSFNIGNTPQVGDTGFTRSGSSPFYQLSPDTYAGLKGEQQFAQEAAIRSRAAELEQAFRSNAATTQQRNLTIA